MDIQKYLTDRIDYLKKIEIEAFDEQYKYPKEHFLRNHYRTTSNDYHARRHELEMMQKNLKSEATRP
jgi:hypothetical protein